MKTKYMTIRSIIDFLNFYLIFLVNTITSLKVPESSIEHKHEKDSDWNFQNIFASGKWDFGKYSDGSDFVHPIEGIVIKII